MPELAYLLCFAIAQLHLFGFCFNRLILILREKPWRNAALALVGVALFWLPLAGILSQWENPLVHRAWGAGPADGAALLLRLYVWALGALAVAAWIRHWWFRRGDVRERHRAHPPRLLSAGRRDYTIGLPAERWIGPPLKRWACTYELEQTEHVLHLPGLPRGWHGARLVLLTDLHLSPRTPPGYLAEVADAVGQIAPDMIAIAGDFVAEPWIDLLPLLEFLPRLTAPHGVFGVLGNHDYTDWPEPLAPRLAAAGIEMLSDTWTVRYRDGDPLVIVGTEWPWTRRARPGELLRRAPAGYKLLLSHTPDNLPEAARHGVGLVLSGHTHGGQIRFPVIGPLAVPSRHGRRFDAGVFRQRGTLLFVSRGIGTFAPCLRIGSRPEISLLELARAED